MPFAFIFQELWRWFASTGINIVLLLILALLVPRAGRFAKRTFARRVKESRTQDEEKSQLAVAGVVVYIVQVIAFFLILVFLLQQLGFSLAGAAIPATVVSAAIGFGAQNIIADFLAGFFILTEKQYGVGDNVSFEGNGVDVSGDVIQITMRATTIRTLNQATVTIPNSAARIYINQSNYWVNAMVVMPVPLEGSESAEHAISRSERAARRALARPDIHDKLQGELMVHPAVDVGAPTAAGQPWTVDMRFMVRVEPLTQWMVERAIRVAVLDEFWDEYGKTPELFSLHDASLHAPHPDQQRSPAAPGQIDRIDRIDREAYPPTERMAPVRPFDPTTDTTAEDPAAEDAAPAGTADLAADIPADGSGETHNAAEDAPKTVFNNLMRASTLWLIIAFIAALIIRGLMLNPDGDVGGVLAPPPRTTTSTTQPSEAEENPQLSTTAPTPQTAEPGPAPATTERSPDAPATDAPEATEVTGTTTATAEPTNTEEGAVAG